MTACRVLGIAQDSGGKWGALYDGLAEHVEIVGVLRPDASRTAAGAALLRNWRVNLAERSLDYGWSVPVFRSRTRTVDRLLARRPADDHDVIVQTQTLCGPGLAARRRPYVIYTDSTHALNQRFRFGGDPTPGRRGEQLQALERGVARQAAHVFAMSEFARGSLIEDYGVDPDRVTVVGAGSSVAVEPGGPEPDRPRAILVGLDFERKGGQEVVAAWPRVREAVPDAELVIVGPDAGEPLPGIRWTGRVRSRAELSHLYTSATVFVLPTLWDPWGLVYHEAMAHGLPCIGTDRFAVPEIVRAGETGLLVPPRAPDAVADALIALLSDPALAAAMGAAGRRIVEAEATWSAVAAEMAPRITRIASGVS